MSRSVTSSFYTSCSSTRKLRLILLFMMSLQEQYFQACLDWKPEATTTPFNDCQGKCPADANKDICREVCHLVTHCVTVSHLSHLVTHDNHRSLSSIWHFATPIFPGLHLDSPWILRGWVRHYTHHWNSEENLRGGLYPRHFSPPVQCSSTKDKPGLIIIDGILYNANIFRGLALLPARLIAPT